MMTGYQQTCVVIAYTGCCKAGGHAMCMTGLAHNVQMSLFGIKLTFLCFDSINGLAILDTLLMGG
jgi:hypothetical protein